MKKARSWDYAAGQLWSVLTCAAQQRKLLTYGEVAPIIETNPLSVRYALGPIQDYCMGAGLPPLTAILVNAEKNTPGAGFIAWDVADIHTAHQGVFDFEWTRIENPYGGFSSEQTVGTLASRLLDEPDSASEIYAIAKVRGTAQLIFRLALIKQYECCAMCGLSFVEALDAAHLKSWSACTPAERMDPANGVLLCATHHRLFDAGCMTISEDLHVVHFDPEATQGTYSEMDISFTTRLHGKLAKLNGGAGCLIEMKYLRHHHHANWT